MSGRATRELILGGARSGKSRLAEERALAGGSEPVYLATAAALDDEMRERILRHQSDRDARFVLVEAPLGLADTLQREAAPGRCILVDCLTLWLSNCLHEGCWDSERDALLGSVTELPGHIIFVSNETGLGVVPMGELTRQFVDAAGFLHQALAARCDTVTLVVAGLPVTLKAPA